MYTARRAFSSSSRALANRAIVYNANGPPSSVLRAQSFPRLPPPQPGAVNLRVRLAPINPADFNVVEGKYPAKPGPSHLSQNTDAPVFIGGNEGLAEVREVGEGVQGLAPGDWVVMRKAQSGTWTSGAVAKPADVIKVPKTISEVHAATIMVNPPTALCMLSDFVDLQPGDWVVQNAANSAFKVGQAVIQIASSRGINTLNFIRPNDNHSTRAAALESLASGSGRAHVYTYADALDKGAFADVRKLVAERRPRLLLNGSCDESLGRLASLLQRGHVVTYGAMAKKPFALPPSLFIFQGVTCQGFWMSGWPEEKGRDRATITQEIVQLIEQGKLREPAHEIVTISKDASDEEASEQVRTIFKNATGGGGKKVLFTIEESDE